MGMTEKGMLAN